MSNISTVHIGEFTNARVYKGQFWCKHELFHWFWVAMDLIRCPGGIGQNFWTPGSAQGAKFGAQREQIAALNFVPFWCPYKFLFNLNTDSMGKTLFSPSRTSRAHFHTCTHGNVQNFAHPHFWNTLKCRYFIIYVCRRAVTFSRINILILGRVGQGQDLKSHIN